MSKQPYIQNLDKQQVYTGQLKYQPHLGTDVTDVNITEKKVSPYLPSQDLVEAVNVAMYLQRPLLLQGEPGCGKTLLARAIAYEFGQRFGVSDYPYFDWHIKSTTHAKEGLYHYDSVGRLRDAQLMGTDAYQTYLSEREIRKLFARLQDPHAYVRWGALGKAFQVEQYRPVVLIDEIDKADIDFPNDLLRELEEKRFTITEIGETIEAKHSPIVIITSNSEKDLPDAFLRRCIFYYLQFPQEERLQEIVTAHFPDSITDRLVHAAVDKFLEMRHPERSRNGGKKPSTSELLDWIQLLQHYDLDEALDIIYNLENYRFLLGTVLKTQSDQELYLQINP